MRDSGRVRWGEVFVAVWGVYETGVERKICGPEYHLLLMFLSR